MAEQGLGMIVNKHCLDLQWIGSCGELWNLKSWSDTAIEEDSAHSIFDLLVTFYINYG